MDPDLALTDGYRCTPSDVLLDRSFETDVAIRRTMLVDEASSTARLIMAALSEST